MNFHIRIEISVLALFCDFCQIEKFGFVKQCWRILVIVIKVLAMHFSSLYLLFFCELNTLCRSLLEYLLFPTLLLVTCWRLYLFHILCFTCVCVHTCVCVCVRACTCMCFALLEAHTSININVIEPWFSVDEKEPVAYAKVEVVEASDVKPSDLNGRSFACEEFFL